MVMVLPQRFASMLLPSVILLLYWTPSSAQSHDSTCSNLSPSYRVKRDLPFHTREQVAASSWVVKDSLNVVQHVIRGINTKTASAVMKGLADFAALAPSIRGLVSHFLNIVLASIPQENLLKELREGFVELNRKLNSLSIQISNLATDVEWFSYVSAYSQDEVRILNGWKKFNEFRENSELMQSEEDKLRLAEIFTNYYENTAVEASVANIYHYLMVISSTSLSGNLNNLLKKKFKCDISEIGKYNLYISSLLWKGLVLNELYWNLIGLDLSTKEVEQTQMFRNVYKAQISAVEFCLNNYEQYMKEDVVEITKALSPDNKTAIADQVKKVLDEKYDWYNWVVLVYDTRWGFNLQDLTVIPVGGMTVAVGYTLKPEGSMYDDLRDISSICFHGKDCENMWEGVQQCMRIWPYIPFKEKVKVTHVIYDAQADVAEVPKPSHTVSCKWHSSTGRISMYFSSRESVCNNTCKNGGTCKRLLDSNEWLCECPDDYYGDRCLVKMDFSRVPKINTHHYVPDISTIDIKLKRMEAKLEKKLEEILNTIKETCPRQ